MATSSAGLQFTPPSRQTYRGRWRRAFHCWRDAAARWEASPSPDGNGLIAVVESEELQAARAGVGNFENGVGGQLVLETQVPLLGVRRDQTRIERVEFGCVRVG